jgi:uncharacterized damage-inducible protein DinB
MKAMELVRWAMRMTEQGTAALVADMRDEPLTCATPGARGGDGNHPIWLLGHLAYIEGAVQHVLLGESNPVEQWGPLFAPGTRATQDAGKYPTFDEVLGKYRELRAANLRMLEALGEAGLDRPPKWVPPGFEDSMKTAGQTLLLICLHNMVHYGQIADARRVAGRKPLM